MVTLLLTLSVMAGSTSAIAQNVAENFLLGRQQAFAAMARCQSPGPTADMRHFSEPKSKPTKGRQW